MIFVDSPNFIIPSYEKHLLAGVEWIKKSETKYGGSSAVYNPLLGWSKPYPETTGYLIPTLIQFSEIYKSPTEFDLAIRFGNWLLSIQNENGSWNSGKYPNKKANESIFNTGQILRGLIALWRATKDNKWLVSSEKGLYWLVNEMNDNGLWDKKDYLSNITPSYYTHVFWPMLEVNSELNSQEIKMLVEKGLKKILMRIKGNGAISNWGFKTNCPAFTHTIAYTIRGIQECGRLLDDQSVMDKVLPSLDKILRISELRGGNLPGLIDEDWNVRKKFTCLTGNLQIAKCLLIEDSRRNDLRLVNGAIRMIDVVCRYQNLNFISYGIKGGVAGSHPFYGGYMRFRYPNWSVKYLCDAIIALSKTYDGIKKR